MSSLRALVGLPPLAWFVWLCGGAIGLGIQLRKVELGFDGLWNERLLLLVVAWAAGLFFVSAVYAALAAWALKRDHGPLYRANALNYSPLLLLPGHSLLTQVWPLVDPGAFKGTAILTLTTVTLLTMRTLARQRRLPNSGDGDAVGWLSCTLGLVVFVGGLEAHGRSIERALFGPDDRWRRAVAIEASASRHSYEYVPLALDDDIEISTAVPAGGKVVLSVKPLPLDAGEEASSRSVVVKVGGRGPEVLRREVSMAKTGEWIDFETIEHAGGAKTLDLRISNDPVGEEGGFGQGLESLLTRHTWFPWDEPQRTVAFQVHRPRVSKPRTGEPNVILISIDMLRPDHVGAYGYGRDTTPNLDRFAEEGTLFKRAYSTDTWTLPSHMTMLSSLYTSSHRANDLETASGETLDFVTLQELLKLRGYSTVGFTDGHAFSARYGFSVGFDDFYEEVGPYRNRDLVDMTKRTVDSAVRWIDEHEQSPFFLLLHTYEAHHFPLTIREHKSLYADQGYEGFFAIDDGATAMKERNFVDRIKQAAEDDSLVDDDDVRYAIDLYDGGIRVSDREIGRFLDYLKSKGLFENSLIVVTSDHGESFRDYHDNGNIVEWYHAQAPFIEQIRVPLIVKFPDQREMRGDVDAAVSLLDIAPTVIDSLGLRPPRAFEGRSLRPVARGEAKDVGHPIIAERVARQGAAFVVTMISESAKYSYYRNWRGRDREAYYSLASDPDEEINLIDEVQGSDQLERMRALVQTHIARYLEGSDAQAGPAGTPVDEDALEELRTLGYVN